MSNSSQMVIRQLKLGDPYPGRPHSVLVHIPTWADMVDFGQGKAQMDYGYPRSVVHPDIYLLGSRVLAELRLLDGSCSTLLFSGARAAFSCKEYILLQNKKSEGHSALADSIRVYSVNFGPPCHEQHAPSFCPALYAVVYPSKSSKPADAFWQRAGPGISSRLAQKCMQYGCDPRVALLTTPAAQRASHLDFHPVYEIVRSRIAGYMQHGVTEPQIVSQVAASDVFLYASGMVAIHHVHQSLLDWRLGESVNAGLLYEPTLRILQTQGPGLKSYSMGTEADLDRLASQLERTSKDSRPVQAVWCECPSNPLLETVNLQRLRRLADQHGLVVVVDDSVGSFANVDLLGVADIVISSLSKYFSGYADVMAGSVVLNPNSAYYATLQKRMSATYENSLFVEDAIRLESNSRDFLPRMARVNETTQYLVDQLSRLVPDPAVPLTRIFHPSVCASRPYYEYQMRRVSSQTGFRAGYGGVFTMEFASVASAAVFFDALHVYKGLSFGADVCLASPYVQMTGQDYQQEASAGGVKETIIRFSVGLEEAGEILHRIQVALDAAAQVWRPKVLDGEICIASL